MGTEPVVSSHRNCGEEERERRVPEVEFHSMNGSTVAETLTKEEQWVLKEKYVVTNVRGLRNPSLVAFEADRDRLACG